MSFLVYISFALEFIPIIFYALGIILQKFLGVIFPQRPKSLKKEIILVSGGASGIGREICRQLVLKEVDLTIVIWDKDGFALKAIVKELEAFGVTKAVGFVVDVSSRENVKNAAQQTRKEVGDVTMLFNIAGVQGEFGPGWSRNPKEVEEIFEVNLLSHIWTQQEFLPAMINMKKGHLVEMNSILGLVQTSGWAPYSISKTVLGAFVECINADIADIPTKPQIHITMAFPTMENLNSNSKTTAQKIVEGVLRNQERIYFGKSQRFLPMLIGFFPSPVYSRFIDMAGNRLNGKHIR